MLFLHLEKEPDKFLSLLQTPVLAFTQSCLTCPKYLHLCFHWVPSGEHLGVFSQRKRRRRRRKLGMLPAGQIGRGRKIRNRNDDKSGVKWFGICFWFGIWFGICMLAGLVDPT